MNWKGRVRSEHQALCTPVGALQLVDYKCQGCQRGLWAHRVQGAPETWAETLSESVGDREPSHQMGRLFLERSLEGGLEIDRYTWGVSCLNPLTWKGDPDRALAAALPRRRGGCDRRGRMGDPEACKGGVAGRGSGTQKVVEKASRGVPQTPLQALPVPRSNAQAPGWGWGLELLGQEGSRAGRGSASLPRAPLWASTPPTPGLGLPAPPSTIAAAG